MQCWRRGGWVTLAAEGQGICSAAVVSLSAGAPPPPTPPPHPAMAALLKLPRTLLQGQKTMVFGVPDCGRVCSEQHLPGYLAEADRFRQLGITQILCVVVGEPGAAAEWAAGLKVDPSKVRGLTSLHNMNDWVTGRAGGPWLRSLRGMPSASVWCWDGTCGSCGGSEGQPGILLGPGRMPPVKMGPPLGSNGSRIATPTT